MQAAESSSNADLWKFNDEVGSENSAILESADTCFSTKVMPSCGTTMDAID